MQLDVSIYFLFFLNNVLIYALALQNFEKNNFMCLEFQYYSSFSKILWIILLIYFSTWSLDAGFEVQIIFILFGISLKLLINLKEIFSFIVLSLLLLK